MPIVREPGTDARPIRWDGWRAWKLRFRLPEVIEYRDAGSVERALPDGDEHGGPHVQATGEADNSGGLTAYPSCFACVSHPGRVFTMAPNGEGRIAVPCPVCAATATDGQQETTA